MSRDWAPFEHYLSEKEHIKAGRGDLFAFLENLTFHYADGRKEVLNPPEEMAIRRQFPMLGKLLMDDFMELHGRLSRIDGGIDFLHRKDDELARFVETRQTDEENYLIKWFLGKLDEHFYYSDRNNEMFLECMLNEAMVLNREPYDEVRFEAALQRFSGDIAVEDNRDYLEGHANKLIYCCEHNKDFLDFDFWVQYEFLLGEKITWEEYAEVDRQLDGSPYEFGLPNKKTIAKLRETLAAHRAGEKGEASLEENIQAAEAVKAEGAVSVESKAREEVR